MLRLVRPSWVKSMSQPANKVVISCAVTGSIHTPTMSDALPITPDQIAEQVAKIRRIMEELGYNAATPNEARELLGLKGADRVNF